MALEIERKFLVKPGFDFKTMAESSRLIRQAYLSVNPDATVRVRTVDDAAFVTIKSRNKGAVRNEWEYPIPIADALEMMALPGVKVLEKTRYIVVYDGLRWEVDVFSGSLKGVVLAEIELEDESEAINLPPFVDVEVTGDARYYNSNLVSQL